MALKPPKVKKEKRVLTEEERIAKEEHVALVVISQLLFHY
jgi:hypothetical protein